jgi:phosphatidylserine/phosphatidylglycerophosphate/cardiolipin synthase-like enzyme
MAIGCSESLLAQIRQVAKHLPEEKLIAVAQALQQPNRSLSSLTNRLTQLLPKPSWRQSVIELLEIWSQGNDFALETVAAMLLTAEYCQQQFQQELFLEFVWTGPLPEGSYFRRTDQALLELIRGAQQTLLIVSFAIYNIPEIFNSLRQAQARGVALTFLFEVPEASDGKISYNAFAALEPALLKKSCVLMWDKNKRPTSPDGKTGSLHAKFAIADAQKIFISSANLTSYAMTLNIEMGVLIHSSDFALEVSEHISKLISSGHFVTDLNV